MTSKSEAAKKRWANSEQRQYQSRKAAMRIGHLSSRAKLWSLQSPAGNVILTWECKAFCLEHGISFAALKAKARTHDMRPISRGSAKGWAVLFAKSRPSKD